MGKTVVIPSLEEVKERHEFKRRKRELEDSWNNQLYMEQLHEVCGAGCRDNDQEQRQSIHEGE